MLVLLLVLQTLVNLRKAEKVYLRSSEGSVAAVVPLVLLVFVVGSVVKRQAG